MKNRYEFSFEKYELEFKRPAGTSRGILRTKPSFLVKIEDTETHISGRGECSLIPGLNPETEADVFQSLKSIQEYIQTTQEIQIPEKLLSCPSVRFGMETVLLDLQSGGNDLLFHNSFSEGLSGIPINGLIWMENVENMWQQIILKIKNGFHCIKMKVGALDFRSELDLLERIRVEYGNEVELRLDANGAFTAADAFRKLERLGKYNIHSIEQPVRPGQKKLLHELCLYSPIPVASDEELIGIKNRQEKTAILEDIKPAYIILKPSLIGGMSQAQEWITLASQYKTGWWATSALESNIGLNAIAQWAANYDLKMPQGLGTGSLYTNNIPMGLDVIGDELWRIKR